MVDAVGIELSTKRIFNIRLPWKMRAFWYFVSSLTAYAEMHRPFCDQGWLS